jgi:hypothetical protein
MSGHRFMISQTSNAGAELAAAKRQERAAVLGCPAGTVPARNVLKRRLSRGPPDENRTALLLGSSFGTAGTGGKVELPRFRIPALC